MPDRTTPIPTDSSDDRSDERTDDRAPGGPTMTTALEDGPPRLLHVRGSVDRRSTNELSALMAEASRRGFYRLHLDLTGVDVLDDAAITALERAHRQHAAHSTELSVLTAAGTTVDEVVAAAGLPRTPVSLSS